MRLGGATRRWLIAVTLKMILQCVGTVQYGFVVRHTPNRPLEPRDKQVNSTQLIERVAYD